MPAGYTGPARNLFLLGSSGSQTINNFFESISKASTNDGVFAPDEIRYISSNKKYALAGTAEDSNSQSFGWIERQDYEIETETLTTDYSTKIVSTQPSVNTTLRAMELDSNDNLIVVGKVGSVPWIAKYSNDAVLDWQSTTSSADVEYFDVASDSYGKYYACGITPLTATDTQAFVESFDQNGNPGWGKSAYMLGRDVTTIAIDANNQGHVVAVGYLEDDSRDKGYIVKINTGTGELMWDRTLSSDLDIQCTDVFIDSKDQIYVIANDDTNGYLIKYTAAGNMIWQKKTNQSSGTISYTQVHSEGLTEQTIVYGIYTNGSDQSGVLSKYSRNGTLLWRRTILSSSNNSDTFSSFSVDADTSYYYFLYTDQAVDGLAGTPDTYTFGRVSSSGNGLGDFQYDDGGGNTIDYEIINVGDVISKLSDGSVRNDTSDLMTYPFSANKLVFDDFATPVSNKKKQMDGPDSFLYSGSPAIRNVDFPLMHLSTESLNTSDLVESSFSGSATVGRPKDLWWKFLELSDDERSPEKNILPNGNFQNGNAYDGWTAGNNAVLSNYTYTYGISNNISQSLSIENSDILGAYAWRKIPTQPGFWYAFDIKLLEPDANNFYSDGYRHLNIRIGTTFYDNDVLNIEDVNYGALSQYSRIAYGHFYHPPSVPAGELFLTLAHTASTHTFYDNPESLVGGYGYADPHVSPYDNGSPSRVVVEYMSIVENTWYDISGNNKHAGGMFQIGNDDDRQGFYTSSTTGDVEELFHTHSTTSMEQIVETSLDVEELGNTFTVEAWIKRNTNGIDRYYGTAPFDYVLEDIQPGYIFTAYATDFTAAEKISYGQISLMQGISHNFLPYVKWQLCTSKYDGQLYKVGTGGGMTNLYETIGPAATIPQGSWCHLVMCHRLNTDNGVNSIGEYDIYINGKQICANQTDPFDNVNSHGKLLLGKFDTTQDHGGEFGGYFGDIRVYQKSLTEAQVFQNYNATKSKYINEAPDTAPKITSDVIKIDTNLTLNYDFGNRACIDSKGTIPTNLSLPDILETETLLDDSYILGSDDYSVAKIAVGEGIILYTSDGENLKIYDFDGNYINQFNSPIEKPFAVGSAPAIGSGRIAVCHFSAYATPTSTDSIHIFNLNGDYLLSIHDDFNPIIEQQVSGYTSNGGWGASIAIYDNKLYVGQPYPRTSPDPNALDTGGKVKVYNIITGALEQILSSPDTDSIGTQMFSLFGGCIAVGQGKLLIGATGYSESDDDISSSPYDTPRDSGAVYIFDVDNTYTFRRKIRAESPDSFPGDYYYGIKAISEAQFGTEIDIAGDRIVVSAPRTGSGFDLNSGAAFLFDIAGNFITELTIPSPEVYVTYSRYGYQVAISEDYVFVSRPKIFFGSSGTSIIETGDVFVFDTDGNYVDKVRQQTDPGGTGEYGWGMRIGNSPDLRSKLVIAGAAGKKLYTYDLNARLTSLTCKNLANDDSIYTGFLTTSGSPLPTLNSTGYLEFSGPPGSATLGALVAAGSSSEFNWVHDRTKSDWAIEGWFWNNRDNDYGGLVSNSSETTESGFYMGQRNDGLFECVINNGTGTQACKVLSTDALDHNMWYHIAFVNENYTVKMYVNGVLQSNASDQNSFATNSTADAAIFLLIGKVGLSNTWNLDGRIAAVRMYQTSLSATEVLQNFNSTKSKYNINLLLNYEFGNKDCIDINEVGQTFETDLLNSRQLLEPTSTPDGPRQWWGASLTIGSGKIVIGCDGTGDPSATGDGNPGLGDVIYVYDLDGQNETLILNPEAGTIQEFNRGERTLAIFGTKLYVGCPFHGTGGTIGGVVYVFNLNTGTLLQTITASDVEVDFAFGSSIAVDEVNENLIVGAPQAYELTELGEIGDRYGAAYVYDLDSSGAVIGNEMKLTHSDPYASPGSGTAGDRFGDSVAIGQGKIAVGAPTYGSNQHGVVYVYDLDGTDEVKLSPESGTLDLFGYDLEIGEDKLVIGVRKNNSFEYNLLETGSIYIYNLFDLTTFTHVYPSDVSSNDEIEFGRSVSIGEGKIAVGCWSTATDSDNDRSVYLYDLDGTNEIKFGLDVGGLCVAIGDGHIVTTSPSSPTSTGWNDNGYGNIYSIPAQTAPVNNLTSSSYPSTLIGSTINPAGYLEFDGIDDQIATDETITHGTDAITYECWVKTVDGYSPSNYVSLMSTYDPDPQGFWILLNPTNAYVTAGNDGSTFHISSTAVNDGNWHHVVATYDNPNVRIYVDGVDVGGLSNAPNNNIPARTLSIGSMKITGSYDRFFDGEIGEVRVYNKALTAVETFKKFDDTKSKYGL